MAKKGKTVSKIGKPDPAPPLMFYISETRRRDGVEVTKTAKGRSFAEALAQLPTEGTFVRSNRWIRRES